MELRHLRYFLMLAEELHFGKAAKRLFISQPPLSRQIKELEEELGVTLFLRDNKRVVMTEAGHYFAQEAQETIKRLHSAKQQVSRIHQSLSGEIKIGYISSTDKRKLGLLIQRLQDSHPYLQTKLYELSSERQLEALCNGNMDLGIIRAPVLSPQIQVEKLYDDGFVLATPSGVLLPDQYSLLSNHPFISYHADYAPIYHSQLLAYCANLGFSPNLRHECNNIASILELVHLGAGISVVPSSVQCQYLHLNINFLTLGELNIKTDILLAHNKVQKHPAFTVLRDLVKKIFEE
ncbi:LysR family transcriptional regulator [Sphingobacterium sp. LRF_L2]|uniref:LysR family transcriptional regulator n=1 Tax=Sphingobacterium sp. LRF_L2 TaxID=3369421 RepID=UPI003F60F9CE